jgi:hypothetical protein
MLINQLPLPTLLIDLIDQGRWKIPQTAVEEDYQTYFAGHYLTLASVVLYDLPQIISRTELLKKNKLEDDKVIKPYRFKKNRYDENIQMDYEKTLLIGDLLYHEQLLITPIALYFHEVETPIVIILPDDSFDRSWLQVSPDFASFIKDLNF